MATLIADRFLFCGGPAAPKTSTDRRHRSRVGRSRKRLRSLRPAHADEQQTWVEACARAYAEGRLVDFGFSTRRTDSKRHCRTARHGSAPGRLRTACWNGSSIRVPRLGGFFTCRRTPGHARSSLARIRAVRARAPRRASRLSVAIWPLLAKRSVAASGLAERPGAHRTGDLAAAAAAARESVRVLAPRSHATRRSSGGRPADEP